MKKYVLSDAVCAAAALDDSANPYHDLFQKPIVTLGDHRRAIDCVEGAPAFFGDCGPDHAGEKRACIAASRKLRARLALLREERDS